MDARDADVGMNPKLAPFVQIVNGMASILGEDCEILLHDVSRFESSIVACANGHITGRAVGSPMSVFGVELVNSDEFSKHGDVYTYMARVNNEKLIKCGVIPLRDEQRRIIGLMCLHFDTTKAAIARKLLDRLFTVDNSSGGEPVNEFFGLEIGDVFKNTFDEAVKPLGKAPRNMSRGEKVGVVGSLIDRGFFMMKGAVEYVAGEMGNSKFTVYAYMREARGAEDGSAARPARGGRKRGGKGAK
ncbi:MAG: helix-turn-helix transcriptional regulator [Synergistaceae bacterium]|jgi:predicted transcriptional regulator YheO|nr:helix-turn-helix transcriptional regulator [Synergistaceae bacterium]